MLTRWYLMTFLCLLVFVLMQACNPATLPPVTPSPTMPSAPQPTGTSTPDGIGAAEVTYHASQGGAGLSLRPGGDHDTERISLPGTGHSALRTGNGNALPANDGNDVGDFYIQFQVQDAFLYAGMPTSRIVFVIEYLDEGTDSFNIQYDALSGGPYGNGQFKDTMTVQKTGSGEIRTVEIPVCDANFENRDQDADFRIADGGDGAESILSVVVRRSAQGSGSAEIHVDSCGADPFDEHPDSDAIQSCISQACSGDTVLFTSGVSEPGYQGYLIDKTVFLVYPQEKQDLTFRSTQSNSRALLKATADLKGFVVHLFPRSRINDAGLIDRITIERLEIDGNQAERVCMGSPLSGQAQPLAEGENDNWGSWLGECSAGNPGDAWCNAGSLYLGGDIDASDPDQQFEQDPDDWSTGMVVRDMTLSNTECGTAFFFSGAAFQVSGLTIDLAGEHTHFPGCQLNDTDDRIGAWADGITFLGPAHQLTNNTIMDPSDIGIVSFGGRDIQITNNTILARPGNHGMFAGIAMHPNTLGSIGGLQVTGNQVINQADPACGGIHMGINLGVHTWANGCIGQPGGATYGTPDDCSLLAPAPQGKLCDTDTYCRTWGHVPIGEQVTMADNVVNGAQVSFVISGLDVLGELVLTGNQSVAPQLVGWEHDESCVWDSGVTDSWGVLDFVAINPSIPGWTQQRIVCAR